MKEDCEIIIITTSAGTSRICKVHGLACFELFRENN